MLPALSVWLMTSVWGLMTIHADTTPYFLGSFQLGSGPNSEFGSIMCQGLVALICIRTVLGSCQLASHQIPAA